jgi:hypothetical protein
MTEAGVPYLEIPELTETHYPENDRLFGEPIHPNQRGHRLMAARLLKFLASEGMLWDLSGPELPTVGSVQRPPPRVELHDHRRGGEAVRSPLRGPATAR